MMRIFARRISAGMVAAALGGLTGAVPARAAEPNSGDLDIIQVRPNFYMIAGAGGNISVQIGVDGVVLVDTGTEASSDRVLAAIKKLTPLPIRYIMNTGAEPDH